MKELRKFDVSLQSEDVSASMKKGTIDNPYSVQEYEQLQEQNLWEGGYVEKVGEVVSENSTNEQLLSYYGSPIDYDFGNDGNDEIEYAHQTFNGTCVPTVMSYAAIALGCTWITEGTMIAFYKYVYDKDYPIHTGLAAYLIKDFVERVFEFTLIEKDDFKLQQALASSKPVIGTLLNEAHEVLIKRSVVYNNKIYYECINPGNGSPEMYELKDFYNNSFFKLNSVKSTVL